MEADTLRKELAQLGASCDDAMAEKLICYMERVLEWNQHVNMTAISDRHDFLLRHFVDSLACCGWDELAGAKRVIDVGTGAGFPGIPLAVLFPEKRFTLLDSLGKRIRIIKEITTELAIGNVELVHGRAEDLAREPGHREAYDLCVSRAVADLSVLLEYCLPFLRVGGSFLAYKGADIEEELRGAGKAMKELGGRFQESREVVLDGGRLSRNILVIAKTRPTPKGYPRRAGLPERKPL